jgi:outer membrane protein TolC
VVHNLKQEPYTVGGFAGIRTRLCVLLLGVFLGLWWVLSGRGAELPRPRELGVQQYLALVLERNESLQVRFLELKIGRKRLQAETGIFEPEMVLGYDRVGNKRENTAEQRRSSGVSIFSENNDLYSAGLEGLIPTGAKVRLGYTLNDLRNNLQVPPPGTIATNKPGEEYQSFAGVSVTQPLLKNAWFTASMANIRLAALTEEVSFQEYRRQLMVVITTAEAAYWNLYLAQEQVRFFRESVAVAQSLVHDNEERLAAGRGSELEVLEAKSGVALRRTKLAEAEQKYFETAAQVCSLMSELVNETAPTIRAKDAPQGKAAPEFAESGKVAFEMNPDYLGQFKKLQQEHIRVAYAKNQRLPQLDLKGSYGLNGLGSTPGSSWDDIEGAGYTSWSVAVELHIPLGGGIRSRNELEAARLRKEQALLTLQDIEKQMLNAITTALSKLRSTGNSVRDYEQIAAYNQDLLNTELKRLETGKVDSKRVLEVDAALLESKVAVVESKVLSERARLELELAQGTVLRDRAMELSQKELEGRTIRRLQDAGVSSSARRQVRGVPGTTNEPAQLLNPAAQARSSGPDPVLSSP